MPGSRPPDPAERTDERPRRRPTRAPEPDPPPGFAGPDDGGALTSLERELLAVVREGQSALLGELAALRGDVRLGGAAAAVLILALVLILGAVLGVDPRAVGGGASQVIQSVGGAAAGASSALPAQDSGGPASAAVEDSPAP